MSRIYFHVRNGEDVEVSGQEAHLIHHIVKQIGIGILYNELINGIGDTPLSSWIKIGHMINELQLTTLCGKDLEHAITALTVGLFHQDTSIKYEDTWISPFAWFLTGISARKPTSLDVG